MTAKIKMPAGEEVLRRILHTAFTQNIPLVVTADPGACVTPTYTIGIHWNPAGVRVVAGGES